MTFFYFCYGSNMLTKRMRINCPSAKKLCIAKLEDFALAFTGYVNSWKGASATIDQSPGDSVWGVVWEIEKNEEEKLDKQEVQYKPIQVNVKNQDSSILQCKSYQKLPMSDDCTKPSLVYKTVIIYGAKEHKLPMSYIQQIEAFLDNGYEGIDVPVNIEYAKEI